MKLCALTTLLAVAGLPASSFAQLQPQTAPPTTQALLRGGDWYQGRTRADGNDRFAENSRQCLRHRKTGRTVCLYRSEWEEVASGKRNWNGKRLGS